LLAESNDDLQQLRRGSKNTFSRRHCEESWQNMEGWGYHTTTTVLLYQTLVQLIIINYIYPKVEKEKYKYIQYK